MRLQNDLKRKDIKLKKGLVTFLLVFLSMSLQAQTQKTVSHEQQIWGGYFNQTRISDKWGFWVDLQLRTREDFVDHMSTSLNRFGLTYYLTDNVKLTAGYAYVVAYPEGSRTVAIPEHRPWQQVQWHTKYGKKRMMQWIRLDERYRRRLLNQSTLSDDYSFNYRIRYNIFYDIPLSSKGIVPKAWSFVVNDEVHINFGKQIVNNTFDQNRFYLGLKYQLSESINLQAGYMNVFLQQPSGNQYRSLHVPRISFFQNLDLRKKD